MKAILIDDDTLALELLEQKLNIISELDIIEKFTHFDITENRSLINEIDLVFLDIELPQMNGLDLAEKLLEINPHLFVVFVTALNEHAVDTFELNALDYVKKPVQTEQLRKTLNQIKLAKNKLKNINENQLKINLFKELSFELEDGSVEKVQWRTAKAKELFLYLLHHRNNTVRKDELVTLLWNNLDHDKAYSQLYATIYLIRKSTSIFTNHLSIKNKNDGYVLETNKIVIDVVDWEENMTSLPPINMKNAPDYELQLEAYTSSYLQQYNYLWAKDEKHRLDQLWLKTAFKLARFYEEKLDFDKAENWFKKMCQFRPEEDEAHFSLMKLYAKLGYGMLVNYQYLQLKKEMEALNLEMNRQIIEWYENWR